jgi:undecaprenyl diphosphate synthase
MIGNIERLPKTAHDRLSKCIQDTSHCNGLTLVLALSYSARWEIVEAARKLAKKAVAGEIKPEDINDQSFAAELTTFDMPDPDLLIRTGGDLRVSNFLLWQIAYTEIFVTSTYWPDFSKDDFVDAVLQYEGRQRRFGLTGEQVQ